MDQKKQDLNPELKQIYERVMNTQVSKPETPIAGSATPPPPATPDAASAQTAPPPPQPNPTGAPFISNAAPKPITENKTFVFTGNKIVTPQNQPHAPANTATPAKKGVTGPIIGVLVVILVVVWGVFWAKIFALF